MSKKVRNLVLVSVFLILAGCSFDKVTGIWNESEEEKRRILEIEKDQREIISSEKIYSTRNIFSKELAPVKNVILTKPENNSSWIMSGSNLQNFTGNNFLPEATNNFLKKKIGKNKFSLSKIISSPLIFNEDIILSDDTGSIFSVNQRGKINWKKNIYVKAYKKIYKNLTFLIYKNKIFVADNIGFIYALNFETGELIWIKNHGVPLRSNIKVIDDKLFVMNQDNRVLCLDTEKGIKIWDIRTISSFIKSQNLMSLAISKNNEIIIINSSGDLIKAETKSGRMYWALNTTNNEFDQTADFFKSSDIVINDKDIFVSTTSNTFSFNIDNGYLNWKQEVGTGNTPIIDGNNVFLITENGYFVNLDRTSGKFIWSINILKTLKKKKRKTKITGFILGSGYIYATSLNGYLIVCSASSGKIKYHKKIGDTITAPPIITDGSLYILTSKSRILGFN